MFKDFRGLSPIEVENNKAKYGTNKLTEQAQESLWEKFKGNLGDPMIKILCVALVINVIFSVLGLLKIIPEGAPEWYESVGIAVAILIATLVSTLSEYNNENSFRKLQEEASQILIKTYRNGHLVEIHIDDLVYGDEILLQAGDKIPADGRILAGEIKVDQSALNGESEEVDKLPNGISSTPWDSEVPNEKDLTNSWLVFRGSIVTSGNAVMKITVIGDSSVYGEIMKEIQEDNDIESPLKLKLSKLADGISKFGYFGGTAIAVAFFIFSIIQNGNFLSFTTLATFIQSIMLGVIIIVMAVPEGLPLMVALVSAQNMGKMLKDNVLVRSINGIETAGSLNILFSDKTGTITKGKLEVMNFIDGTTKSYDNYNLIDPELVKLLNISITQNTSAVRDSSGVAIGGNATERALFGFIKAKNATPPPEVEVTNTIPFNSTNKYSAAQVIGNYSLTLVKGAPEKILDKCKYYYTTIGTGEIFTQEHRSNLDNKILELANRSIRVIALATADSDIKHSEIQKNTDWTLVGLVGIRDDVRPEAIDAIKEVKSAGIQVVMITGDRLETAKAIAKEAGLIDSDANIVITSDELNQMTDEEVAESLPNLRVVARALPSDKSRLVRISQSCNLVVGMTGDGVNDSPALKASDIGFAMGSGTEVAKEAAEISILDDNFLSIKNAIKYGRTIYNSIQKFIIFQLTINISAVLISFISPFIGIHEPLTVIQILWINLIMDTLAALSFGAEPALERYMEEKPKSRTESIISKYMKTSIGIGALYTFGISLVSLLLLFKTNISIEHFGTAYFTLFVFISVFNAFNARTDKINLFDNINKNKGFIMIIGLIAVIQIALVYLGGGVFNCSGLNLNEWLLILELSFPIIIVDLIRKAIVNKK